MIYIGSNSFFGGHTSDSFGETFACVITLFLPEHFAHLISTFVHALPYISGVDLSDMFCL